jgi:hypothetical protein
MVILPIIYGQLNFSHDYAVYSPSIFCELAITDGLRAVRNGAHEQTNYREFPAIV